MKHPKERIPRHAKDHTFIPLGKDMVKHFKQAGKRVKICVNGNCGAAEITNLTTLKRTYQKGNDSSETVPDCSAYVHPIKLTPKEKPN